MKKIYRIVLFLMYVLLNFSVLVKKKRFLFCLLSCMFLFHLIIGAAPSFSERPFPKPRGLVNDFANVIPQPYEQKIVAITSELLQKTGTSVVVVTMPDIGGAECNDYAIRMYNAWEIGKKSENKGVSIFVTIKERKMRITTGYGIEGILTNDLAGEIRDRYIIPYLKKYMYGEGLLNGTIAISQVIAKDAGVKLTALQEQKPKLALPSKKASQEIEGQVASKSIHQQWWKYCWTKPKGYIGKTATRSKCLHMRIKVKTPSKIIAQYFYPGGSGVMEVTSVDGITYNGEWRDSGGWGRQQLRFVSSDRAEGWGDDEGKGMKIPAVLTRNIEREKAEQEKERLEEEKRKKRMQEKEKRRQEILAKKAAEEQKKAEARKRFDEFVKKYDVKDWPSKEALFANPFVYEGKTVAFVSSFETMISATEGIFEKSDEPFLVSKIPKGLFSSKAKVVIAGRVLGKKEIKLPVLGTVLVPHLKFVGVHFCKDWRCSDIITK